MHDITVSKDDLLEQVQRNRADHEAEYEAAVPVYRQRLAEWYRAQADKIEAGEEPETRPNLPKPKSHMVDYDQAIAMLQWEQGDTVEIDQHTFANLVLNDWPWRDEFVGTSILYNGPRA